MPIKPVPTNVDPPKKPAGLSKGAKTKWDELIKFLPEQFLAPIDVYELKILVNLLCQADELTVKLESDKATEATHRIYLNVVKRIHQLSAVFGLNPSDRARLGVSARPTELEDDPIAEFFEALGIKDG